MSFGAYYGANTTIEQAAAGLGGMGVSRRRSGGPTRRRGVSGLGEYFSGTLGQPPVESREDGVLGQPPIDAYTDGVFGMPPRVDAFRSGSLGAEAAHGIGMPPFVDAYRSGSLGVVGGGTTHNVLLADPETIKEVKTVIGMHPLLIGLVAGQGPGQKIWTTDFFTDPIWDERAGKLWALAVEAFAARMKKKPDAVQAMFTTPPLQGASVQYPYPNAAGLTYTLATGFGMPTLKSQFTPEAFPVLYPWYASVTHGAKTEVEPPLFESTGFDMKRAAMWGIGGIAVVGLAMAFFGKKGH